MQSNTTSDNTISLQPNDVICGRGGRGSSRFEHSGTKTFRSLVASNKVCCSLILFENKLSFDFFSQRHYAQSNYKEKAKIAAGLVKTIAGLNPPGRFLEYDKISSQWKEIGEEKVIEKVKQALRENQCAYMKTIEAIPFSENKILEPFSDDETSFLVETFCGERKNRRSSI